jgi:hypothetical protein
LRPTAKRVYDKISRWSKQCCGAYHVGVRGTGVAPFQGLSQDLWAAVLDGGIGAHAQLLGGLALALEVHAMLTFPYPMVRIGDVDAGRTGRPSILTSLTLLVNR